MRPITASDLMNPEILSVPLDMGLLELARFLVDSEISGAPVADDEGRLVGVVSVVDLTRALARLAPEELSQQKVADVMSPGVVWVREEAPVSEVAELMLERHLHRVLVRRGLDTVGIVSTSDVLGLLVDEPRED
ncbi:MAG TPA: CBS domain-containing protein [Thermoanaerobaculia bacterium]|nr:CBS domain-containing protein [Thermoanaerobaculia bacterium]